MELKKIQSVRALRGKRVLLRCDLNIKLASGKFETTDIWKLESIIPTIRYLTGKGARVILVSHRGRPHGYDHDLTLAPVIKKLSHILKKNITLWGASPLVWPRRAAAMKNGEVATLENIRFHHREEAGDPLFAKKLASIADIYVNDAFANIHRSHASMVAVTRYVPSYAGLLMQYELENLFHVLDNARRPIVAIVGGNKISTKIRLLKKLLRRVDYLLLGGTLANNVLAAMEHNIGKSKIEPDMISWSKNLLSNKLRVPVDARVASSFTARPRMRAVGRVGKNDMILDLGPDTIALYKEVLKAAKTIIWNGPLGYFEDPRYAKATYAIVDALASVSGRAYVGGGETVKAVLARRAEKKIHFLSTGGGAMLSLLEGRVLPALRPLVLKW